MRKLLLILFFVPLWVFSQSGVIIEPKINAQTIQGSDTSDFVRTTLPNKLIGQGTADQFIKGDGAGNLSFATLSAFSGIIWIDFTNPDYVKVYRENDTLITNISHVHTEYLLTTGGTINGDLTITGDLTAAITSPKAAAYLDSVTVATTLTQNVWTMISGFTLSYSNATVTFSNDTITVNQSGSYKMLFDPAVSKSVGATAYVEIGFSINGADPLNEHKTGRQFSSADVGFGMLARSVTLSAGDYVVLKARNSTNNDDITVRYGEFSIIKD